MHTESFLLLPVSCSRAQPGTRHCPSSLQQLQNLWALPLAPRWHQLGEQSPAALRLRETLDPSKAKQGCVPHCSPATQGSSGLQGGQQSVLQDELRDKFPTAETHEQRPGEQHSCLQSCPAQTSLAAKATFLSWMSRTCQALQCSDWDPPCPSQNTKTAPKQPSESSCCSPPTLGALGLCSPLVVLSWAVQGQLGTVTWGPVPPCPAAVVALWEWNRTTSAQG